MFVTSILPQWTAALLTALLAALTTRPAAALLATPTIELYSSRILAPNAQMDYANFTKCVFSGYAGDSVTLSGPVQLATNFLGMLADAVFIATSASPFVPDTAVGYMLTDGAATVYLAEDFATPVGFAAPGAFLNLDFVAPVGLANSSQAA